VSINIIPAEQSGLSKVDFNNLEFGKTFVDYMVEADYDGEKWSDFEIKPLENLVMHPGSSALHYGQCIFEGLKAYKNEKEQINIFRLPDNIKRINKSAERMAMPKLPEEATQACILEYVKLQKNWIPARNQGSLYLRPFMIATENTLRAKPSLTYKFMVIACPVGFYYNEPLKIVLGRNFSRAAKGGVGYAKAAGNYAASFYPNNMAHQMGYDQILWTDISNGYTLEELGSANFFYVKDNTLFTAPTKDSILAGITRDTVITLARDKDMKVEITLTTAEEFESLLKEGSIDCLFATGTAASITFVNSITIDDKTYEVKSDEFEPITNLKQEMDAIKFMDQSANYGWNVVV
jgi:branched-chain amino acid aminotransferase